MRRFVLVILLVSACSSTLAAPSIEPGETICAERFCVTVPNGWDAERGDTYLAFRHESAPGRALATISPINMQAMVESAGGTWPATTEQVVTSFWQLLEEAGVAEFEHLERLTGGAFRSEGTHEDGRLWHLVVPGAGNEGIGFEVRAPNSTWEAHADFFFEHLDVVGPG